MSLKTVHISDWARNVLSGAIIEGNVMDPNTTMTAEQFQQLHKIVLALGGGWSRAARKFVFLPKADVESLVRHALIGQSPMPALPQAPEGRWPMPPELAHELIAHARLILNLPVLDFCAGYGGTAKGCLTLGAKVYAVEPDDACVAYMAAQMKGIRKLWHMQPARWLADMTPYTLDRKDAEGNSLPKLEFDAIICNPPHESLLDIGITRALWSFLAPGGTLVGLLSAESWAGDADRSDRFRTWCAGIEASVAPVLDVLHADYGHLNTAFLFVGNKPEA